MSRISLIGSNIYTAAHHVPNSGPLTTKNGPDQRKVGSSWKEQVDYSLLTLCARGEESCQVNPGGPSFFSPKGITASLGDVHLHSPFRTSKNKKTSDSAVVGSPWQTQQKSGPRRPEASPGPRAAESPGGCSCMNPGSLHGRSLVLQHSFLPEDPRRTLAGLSSGPATHL